MQISPCNLGVLLNTVPRTQVSQAYRVVMARTWFKYPVFRYAERADVRVYEERLVLIWLNLNESSVNSCETVLQDVLV